MNKIAIFYSQYFKLLLAAAFMLVIACSAPYQQRNTSLIPINNKLFMEIRQADSVIIGWNAPTEDSFTINNYKLYYRSIRDTNWTLLDSNLPSTTNPQVTIYRNSIKSTDSIFYFGVRCVTTEGAQSDQSSSADSLSIPPGGWFLFWKRPAKK
jgi:hypothetical protein